MSADAHDIEVRFRWVSTGAVILFGAALGIGLLLHVAHADGPWAAWTLELGLLTLMIAPALRLAVAVAERVRRRDWTFVAMTVVVVVELLVVMWRASTKL
jgi:hypothetical protein